MSTEDLYATQTRIFVETGIGTGTPSGSVFEIPLVSAAAMTDHLVHETRTSAFLIPRDRSPIHTSYKLRTSHAVNPAFAGWLIAQHLVGGTSLRRLGNPSPSFVMQYLLEDGDLIEFRGCHLEELQLSLTESRAATMELSWQATSRNTTAGTLEALTGTLGLQRHVSTIESAAAFVRGGTLNPATPRATNSQPVHGAEFIMKRDCEPVQFSPDGEALATRDGPWEVLAEFFLPADADTEAALGMAQGALGLWVGPAGNDLGIQSNAVTAITANDPLQGLGFREVPLRFEFRANSAGQLFDLIDNT